MIKHFIELIIQAINKMIGNAKVDNSIDSSISDTMMKSISLWKKMYKNKAPWVNDDTGVISIGIPKLICKAFKQKVLSEMKTDIIDSNISTEVDNDKQEETKTRADYLNNVYKKKLIKKLPRVYEKALALGGVIIKPYIKNDQVYFDFNYQGEFYPIAFDDDGNIMDIAFLDQFRSGEILYTKVERQTFEYNTVTIENKAFKIKLDANGDENSTQELGEEIPLTEVEKWSTLEPIVEIENVEKPLYGYYCEPISNNIDMDSPLGISFFSDAKDLIKKADEQFGRLDWEYEGGQMARGHRSQIKRERNAQKDTRPSATLSYARVSVQKACFVLDAIRGKDVQTALGILEYNPRYASSLIKKLLESAIANAENNNGMNTENLYVAECFANKGPTMKRVKPRAQGRAYRIEKRMSHITIVLDEKK